MKEDLGGDVRRQRNRRSWVSGQTQPEAAPSRGGTAADQLGGKMLTIDTRTQDPPRSPVRRLWLLGRIRPEPRTERQVISLEEYRRRRAMRQQSLRPRPDGGEAA